jgi:hypothetical protein
MMWLPPPPYNGMYFLMPHTDSDAVPIETLYIHPIKSLCARFCIMTVRLLFLCVRTADLYVILSIFQRPKETPTLHSFTILPPLKQKVVREVYSKHCFFLEFFILNFGAAIRTPYVLR